jgi:hypothetical protein
MNRHLETLILTLRNQKVLFDADLAAIYGVPTRALNQAVKRNARRFPADFVFRLTAKEIANLRAEWGAANRRETAPAYHGALRSQFVTLKTGRGQHLKYLPYAFTEHGALMAANVLNSARAVKMSVYVVRAFIKQREMLMAQADILKRLAQMDKKLLQHDEVLKVIWTELQPLLQPPPAPPKPRIGF